MSASSLPVRAAMLVLCICATKVGAQAVPPEFQVNTTTENYQFDSVVSPLADGGFIVAWHDAAGGTARAQRFSAMAARLGGELTVPDATGTMPFSSFIGPRVAGLLDGGAAIAWSGNEDDVVDDASKMGVACQLIDGNGTKLGTQFHVNTTTAGKQTLGGVAPLGNGGFVVTWESAPATGATGQDGAGSGIYARRFNADGSPASAEFLVNTTTANDQKKPRISALANGGFIIVWTDNGALKAQRYTSTGSKTGGELTIRFSADSYGVAGLKDGGYVVFWTDGGGGVGTEAYARQYDANATAVTGEFSVNTYNVGGQQTYAATGLANGGYVILWISDAQDGSSLGVYGQKFTALGVKEDTEFLVNVRTMDAQTAPAVALLGNGFVATWSSEKQDGSDQGIYGRLFGDTGGGGIIEGTSGPDNLTGTPGNDTINGKAGADVMTGLAGNDTYYVDNAGDSVVESPGEGTDLVRSTISYTLPANVEKLVLTGAASTNAIGNAQDNQLFGNAANNNLNGQAGADTMYGNAGDDTYYVDNAGDVVIERPDEGVDTVRSSVNHTLRPNVENLVLVGTATSGRGNALANRLTGNAANNTLNGGPGNDTLTGGTGQDRFLFDSILSVSRNVDRIIDFDVADDQIRLENEIFTALPATGTLPAAMFEAGAAATTSTTRIIYDPATGSVYYDADGNGKTKPAIRFARLPTGLAVTAADFVVQ